MLFCKSDQLCSTLGSFSYSPAGDKANQRAQPDLLSMPHVPTSRNTALQDAQPFHLGAIQVLQSFTSPCHPSE